MMQVISNDLRPFVDLLILGAGWTSEFLIPLLTEGNISFAATSRDGSVRSGVETIKFQFTKESDSVEAFKVLPDAQTILISFPIYAPGESVRLVQLWNASHPDTSAVFIQLGSSGIWTGDPTMNSSIVTPQTWYDRHSPFDLSNARANAETELLSLSPGTHTTVLDLSGLWGNKRHPRNWVGRVAPSKEALAKKGSIHLIHGLDVARAIIAVHSHFSAASGKRWLLTDERVYDWWDLASAWGSGGTSSDNALPTGHQAAWVRELMDEQGIRALPRSPEQLGRALDSREFWSTFRLSPVKARPD